MTYFAKLKFRDGKIALFKLNALDEKEAKFKLLKVLSKAGNRTYSSQVIEEMVNTGFLTFFQAEFFEV